MLDDKCSINMDESSIVQDVLLEVRNYVQNKVQPSAAYLHSPCISGLHLGCIATPLYATIFTKKIIYSKLHGMHTGTALPSIERLSLPRFSVKSSKRLVRLQQVRLW